MMQTTQVASQPTDLIQSLQRGLRVLEYVAGCSGPVAPKQVAAAVGLNLSTAYHLVNTLVHDGYLVKEPGFGLAPGRRLTDGGATEADSQRLVPIRRALGRAAYACSDVALLATLHQDEAVVTALEAVPGAPNVATYRAGARHLPHMTAVGRAMLASQRDPDASRTLERIRALALARNAPFSDEPLAAELARIRDQGYGFALFETEACVGAPVFDASGRPVGAIALVVHPRRLRSDPDGLAAIAQRTAASVSQTLARLELMEERPRGLQSISNGLIGVPAHHTG